MLMMLQAFAVLASLTAGDAKWSLQMDTNESITNAIGEYGVLDGQRIKTGNICLQARRRPHFGGGTR